MSEPKPHRRRLIAWTPLAWEDYLYWQKHNKKILKRINQLIQGIQSTPFTGIGKPEPLKFDLEGKWSRRIDREHRLIYEMDDKSRLVIFQCRYHYSK